MYPDNQQDSERKHPVIRGNFKDQVKSFDSAERKTLGTPLRRGGLLEMGEGGLLVGKVIFTS